MKTWWTSATTFGTKAAVIFIAAIGILLLAPTFEAQTVDLCGCGSVPGLRPFTTADPTTLPPFATDDGSNLVFTVPPDGILKYSSFSITNRHVFFRTNAANTPVTILVSGDVSLIGSGCCYNFSLAGSSGSGGNSVTAGVGGAGGPGGFRGGDGASLAINGAAIGGAGFGPGGGAGGTQSPFTHAAGGTFLGLPELLPLVGGSGGGGGASLNNSATSCSGGGGGGGGGALLVASNGTMTIANYNLIADGGSGAGSGNGNCASNGGGGSGGALRLIASRLAGGNGNLSAAAGSTSGINATVGRIRLESIDSSAQTQFNTSPPALRIVGPTPIANPVNPTVAITSVGGSAVPAVPQGNFGAIDVVLPAPGPTPVTVATSGVPSGTTVAISVKPRIGGLPVSQTVPLTDCNTAGACGAAATFDLAAGAYVIEARATFQIQ